MRTGQPNYISPVKSQAQFDMLTRVAADPGYAAQRGIDQATAAKMLAEHAAVGSPALVPGHVGDRKDKGPTPRLKKGRKFKLLGAR